MNIKKKKLLDGFSIPFFLAAPFNKDQEACLMAETIEHLSNNRLRCCSHWMFQPEVEQPTDDQLAEVAVKNRIDMDEAAVLILFDGISTSGGLHFEAGYFAAQEKLSIIVRAAEFLRTDSNQELGSNNSIYFTTGKKWTESINMLHLNLVEKTGLDIRSQIARKIILTIAKEIEKDIVFNPQMEAWRNQVNSEAAKSREVLL